MSMWTVKKYVRPDGTCPFDEWYESKALTTKDRAAIDRRVDYVEQHESLPAETLKKYQTTDLKELKVRGDKKQLRPLCVVVPEKSIIILSGAIEKGSKIPKGDLEAASNLMKELAKGKGSVKDYHKD